MNKTLLGLMAIGTVFFAGSAAAFSGTLGGSQDLGTDVNAHVDYSGVLDAVGEAQGQAQAVADAAQDVAAAAQSQASSQAQATADVAIGTEHGVQASAQKDADAGAKASLSAKQGVFDSITGELHGIASWIGSLWVKPTLDAKPAMDATATGSLADQVAKHDGSLDAYYGSDLASTARVDYNIPPPPTPSVGFLGEIQATFDALLSM
jgi:hypothetical protein